MTLLIRSTIKKFCYLVLSGANNKTLAAIKAARCRELFVVGDVDDLLKKLNTKTLSFLYGLAYLSN